MRRSAEERSTLTCIWSPGQVQARRGDCAMSLSARRVPAPACSLPYSELWLPGVMEAMQFRGFPIEHHGQFGAFFFWMKIMWHPCLCRRSPSPVKRSSRQLDMMGWICGG